MIKLIKVFKNKNKKMKNIFNFWEKYYIHSWVLTFILFIFYVLWSNNSFLYTSIIDYKNIASDPFDGTVYPVEFVPDPFVLTYEQRKQNYKDIDSKSFIKIPKYDPKIFGKNPDDLNSNSSEYKEVVLSRVIFTIPYLWTYNFDYKEYAWSHPWVDIILPTWTPVRSIANWVVVDTWYQPAGFWNYIVVRHDWVKFKWEEKELYSLYAHLDSIVTSNWVKVSKWDYIWTVGQTWTATTSHLHFQIDDSDAPYHPYWPITSAQMQKAWVWFFDAVNIWLWKEEAILYTINPFDFVNENLNTILVKNDEDDKLYTNNWEVIDDNVSENEENLEDEFVDWSKDGNNKENESIPSNETDHTNKEENIENQQPTNDEEENTETKDDLKNSKPVEIEDITKEDIELLSASYEDLINSSNKEVLLSNQEENVKESSDSNNYNSGEILDPEEELLRLLDSLKEDEWILEEEALDVNEDDKIFSDIKNDYKYYDEVKYFKDNKIISGFSDNTFRPYNNVTRTESLKIILLSLWITPISWEESKFNDISTNSWENTYINAWVQEWIVSTDNINFYPFRNISRVESLKMILNLWGADLDSLEDDLSLDDISKDDWFYKYVNYSVKNNLIDYSNNNFQPNKPLTREELIKILYKFIKK